MHLSLTQRLSHVLLQSAGQSYRCRQVELRLYASSLEADARPQRLMLRASFEVLPPALQDIGVLEWHVFRMRPLPLFQYGQAYLRAEQLEAWLAQGDGACLNLDHYDWIGRDDALTA